MVKSRQFSASNGDEVAKIKDGFIKNEKVFSESVLLSELNDFFETYNKDFVVISHLKEILTKDLSSKNQKIVDHAQKKLDKVSSIINLLEDVKKQQRLLAINRQENIVKYVKAMSAYYEKFDASQRKVKNHKLLHSKEYKEYLQETMLLSNYENLSLKEITDLVDINYLTEKEKNFAKTFIIKDEETFKKNLKKISKYRGYISRHFLPNSLKDAEEMVDGKYIDYDKIEKIRKTVENIKKQINEFYKIGLDSKKRSLNISEIENESLNNFPITSDLKNRKFSNKNFNTNLIKTIDMNVKIIEFLLAKLEYFKNFNTCEKDELRKEIFNLSTQNKNLALNSLKLEKLSAKNMEYIIKQINYSDKLIEENMDKTNEVCANESVEKFKRDMALINMFNTKIDQILKNDALNEENRAELYILNLANKNLRRDEENIMKSLSGSYKNILKSLYDKQLVINCDKQIKNVNQVVFDDKNFDDNDIDKYINNVVKENKFDKDSLITKRILEPNNISIENNNVKTFECYNEKNQINVDENSTLCVDKPFQDIFIQKTLETKIKNVKEKKQKMREIKVKCGKGFFRNLFAKIRAFHNYKKSQYDLFKFKKSKYVKSRVNLVNYYVATESGQIARYQTGERAIAEIQPIERQNNIQNTISETERTENSIVNDRILLKNLNEANKSMVKKLLTKTYKFLTFSK